jgi:hypothetical protein
MIMNAEARRNAALREIERARKLHTNRANSIRSTGPKTAKGRATAARNARRHGLSVPILSDPTMSAEVDTMAERIASDASPELVELARHIAETEIDVIRVRRARSDLVSRALSDPGDRIPVCPRHSERTWKALAPESMKR